MWSFGTIATPCGNDPERMRAWVDQKLSFRGCRSVAKGEQLAARIN